MQICKKKDGVGSYQPASGIENELVNMQGSRGESMDSIKLTF